MTQLDPHFSVRYPQTYIETGARIPNSCRLGTGCQIATEACLEENVLLERGVRILGQVTLRRAVIVGPNALLIGPLDVGEETILSSEVKVGAVIAASALTRIGRETRIGIGAEILAGVELGPFCRLRARSRLQGDLPAYGLAGGNPAVLENYICPHCHTILNPVRRVGEMVDFGCPKCAQTRTRIPAGAAWPKVSHVLLPNQQSGPLVSLGGYDPHWHDQNEMLWRG